MIGTGGARLRCPKIRRSVPSRVAVAAEWTETIVTDHFTLEPGDRALEQCWVDR